MFGLIYLAARVSRERYVVVWALAWLSLFLAYTFRVIERLPSVEGLIPGLAAGMIDEILGGASTLFIFLTGSTYINPNDSCKLTA